MATIAVTLMATPMLFTGPAQAGTGGTVQVFVEDSSSFRVDGVCLEIIVPDAKNTPDQVVASSAGSGTDGQTGHITMANVPAGSWIGKYYNCGNPDLSFTPFYTGATLNKAKATRIGVTDGGLTDLGIQLILPTGDGFVTGALTDAHGLGIPSVSVIAYSAQGRDELDRSCTDDSGHFTAFNIPSNVGGTKLFFGKGVGCSDDGLFQPTWYGGTTFASAVAVDPGDTASTTALAYATGNATVSSVTFAGTSANPAITIKGTGFGGRPTPNPAGRPCGEPDVATTGYDYGTKLEVREPTSGGAWQAGYPGDCIGLVISSYSSTRIVLTLGDFYRDPSQSYHQLANGDPFAVKVRGTALTGTISGLS